MVVNERYKLHVQLWKHFFFWLCFFALNRGIFLINYSEKAGKSSFGEILSTFWHAIYLDISMACYLLALPLFLILLQAVLRFKLWNYILNAYMLILILAYACINAAELSIYGHWGTKLNYKALWHLWFSPDEAFKTTTWQEQTLFYSVSIGVTVLSYWAYRKWVNLKDSYEKRYLLSSLAYFLLYPGLLILGLRGGFQPIPINQSSVYFSSNQSLNIAAVNSLWNLGHSIEQNKNVQSHNPYVSMDWERAHQVVNALYEVEQDTTTSILNTERPNIVLMIMESWSADVIETINRKDKELGILGDEDSVYTSVTPGFHALEKEGLLFTQLYGTGARSDQGMVAIFSGFPAQPTTSIIKQHDKFSKLPCLIHPFEAAGYHSSFHFGGELHYGNIEAYMYHNGFDDIREISHYDVNTIPEGLMGRLGVHDGHSMPVELERLNRFQEPFFSAYFSLSSHTPYDMPMEDVLHWGGNENPYINSMYYSDRELFKFIQEAKQQPWYENTLLVIVADHSHNSPRNWPFRQSKYKKIPMLFLGGALKDELKGTTNDNICAQTDLPATLLAQLNFDHSAFKWSKDLFNPYTKEFAYFSFEEGVGWLEPAGNFAYDYYWKELMENGLPEKNFSPIMERGKAQLQVLFQEYLDY